MIEYKLEYMMKEEELLVSGKEEGNGRAGVFRIPTDWVSTPHLKIRYNKAEGKLYVASFGDKTMLNERPMAVSDHRNPLWTELPMNSKLVLNGIVGINVFKP